MPTLHPVRPPSSGAESRNCACPTCLARNRLAPCFPNLFQLEVSSDGQHVTFLNLGKVDTEIWMARLGRGDHAPPRDLQAVFRTRDSILYPTLSPSRTSLCFARIDSAPGLHLLDLPAGAVHRLTWGRDVWPAWSRDGRRISFIRLEQADRRHRHVIEVAA